MAFGYFFRVCVRIYFIRIFILGGINIVVCFLKSFSLSWWWVANHQVIWLAHRKLLPKWMDAMLSGVCVCVCPQWEQANMGTQPRHDSTIKLWRTNKKWAKMRATLSKQQQQQQQQGNENVIIETYQIRDGSFNWTKKYVEQKHADTLMCSHHLIKLVIANVHHKIYIFRAFSVAFFFLKFALFHSCYLFVCVFFVAIFFHEALLLFDLLLLFRSPWIRRMKYNSYVHDNIVCVFEHSINVSWMGKCEFCEITHMHCRQEQRQKTKTTHTCRQKRRT